MGECANDPEDGGWGECRALVSHMWETGWRVGQHAVRCQLKCDCPACLGGHHPYSKCLLALL